MLLIHGFGASIGHWRHTIPALARSCDVHALDLLGFGGSDKPRSLLKGEAGPAFYRNSSGPVHGSAAVTYCFDLWAEQVVAFVHEKLTPPGSSRRVHLIGNSIGGVVALNAARLLAREGRPPAQVVLIDCAQRLLDEKRVADLPVWEQSFRPLIKQLVRQRWLIAPLFRILARPAMIRAVLRQAYPSGGNVDDELVTLLHRPATEPGAVESFRGFINLFDDHLAPDLLAELRLPVRMIWGALDPWEDPEEARRWQRELSAVRDLRVLEGLGHCPHDEAPEQVNPILEEWLTADLQAQ